MTSKQLIHRWAQQTHAHGTSGNVRFDGASLTFYREEIGRFYDARSKDDRRVVLISQNSYSSLTSQKQNAAYYATSQYYRIGVDSFTGYFSTDWNRAKVQILELKLKALLSSLQSLEHKRNVTDTIDAIGTSANWLLTFMGEFCKRKDYPKNNALTFNQVVKLAGGRNVCLNEIARKFCPKIVDKFEREQARTAKASAKRIAEQHRYAEQQAENIARWKAGESVQSAFYNLPIYLRIVDDTIETSRGARVPLRSALELYNRIAIAPQLVAGFQIGDFTVRDFIGTNGDRILRVGCHDIPFKEIERIREQLP